MCAVNINIKRGLCLTVVSVLVLSVGGCGKRPSEPSDQTPSINQAPVARPVVDQPLEAFQVQLLETAFAAATAIPAQPFIKDRSRVQQDVIDICLTLNQPVRAVRWADQIDDWRRGMCYAEAAHYLARQGYPAERVVQGLDKAEQIASADHGQRWRSGRIKAKIAQTYILLGQFDKAKELNQNLTDAAAADMITAVAATSSEVPFEDHIKSLDAVIPLTDFELTQGALYGYAALFDRYYEEVEKRDLAEAKIKTAWEAVKLPLPIRLDILIHLNTIALDHRDTPKAQELLNQAQEVLDSFDWPLKEYLERSAELVKQRYRSGDSQRASADAKTLMALFEEKGDVIVDIKRAGAIRPLAEAYQVMGDTETARAVYGKAVEAGLANANFKPRAEDIAATCGSMALSGVEPDTTLWERIHDIVNGLDCR